MKNVLLVLQLKLRANLRSLREPIDRDEWSDLPPVVVNAYYDPSFNDIGNELFFHINLFRLVLCF